MVLLLRDGMINNNGEEKKQFLDFKVDLHLLRKNDFLSPLKHPFAKVFIKEAIFERQNNK